MSHVPTILKSDRSVFENTLADTEDPDEMPHIKNAAFHLGMHCLLKPLSHQALAQSGSNIPRAVRSQANLDIFRGKGPITASLQRPWRSYGVLVGNSLRSYHAFTASCDFTTFELH